MSSKWGVTQVMVNKCAYTWTINNFSFLRKKIGEELESPCFSIVPDEEPKWCLRLYLNGINENFKDFLSLYLYRKYSVDYTLEGRYALSVLNAKREKFIEEREDCQYNKNYTSWGFPALIERDVVRDPVNDLLTNDSLTFFCEIAIVTDTVNFSHEVATCNLKPSRDKNLILYESALDDFEKLLLDERFSDVKLIASCGKELPAHKNVLAARSPIFLAMFEHDMVERKLNRVEILDVDYDVLVEMLRYVYGARVERIDDKASGLLVAADKYGIEGLKDLCERVLSKNMSVDNVVDVLVVADRHNVDSLKRQAMNFVRAHVKSVVDTAGFENLTDPYIFREIIRQLAH